MTKLKEYDPTAVYEDLFDPIQDKELDDLSREIYGSYGCDGTPGIEIFDLLSKYLITNGFTQQCDKCFRIFTKDGIDKVIVTRICQNSMFEIDPARYFETGINDIDEAFVCYFPNGNENVDRSRNWINYMYENNYPRNEILDLINQAKIIIQNTPEKDLGNLEE